MIMATRAAANPESCELYTGQPATTAITDEQAEAVDQSTYTFSTPKVTILSTWIFMSSPTFLAASIRDLSCPSPERYAGY